MLHRYSVGWVTLTSALFYHKACIQYKNTIKRQ